MSSDSIVTAITDDTDVSYRRLDARGHTDQAWLQQLSLLNAAVVEMPVLAAVEIIASLHNAVDVGVERRVVFNVEVLFAGADNPTLSRSRTVVGDFQPVQSQSLATHEGEHLQHDVAQERTHQVLATPGVQ